MDERKSQHCCFDDWVDHYVRGTRRKATATAVAAALLDAIDAAGLDGRTVLDLGCGIGDLSIEAVRRGASGATGFDLSAKAIEQARRLARDRGVAERTTYEVGDGAKVDLPPSDVVALNRVFCCYPDVDGLLERSLRAAGSVYAFSIPRSTGLVGAFSKVQTALANVWYRLRASKFGDFRVYIHDVRRIDARVRDAGFAPVRREHRRIVWDLAVYARPDGGGSTNDHERGAASNPSLA